MTEHVILVAFTVDAHSRPDAHDRLMRALELDGLRPHVSGWWVAEDDRRDGSDGDSAAFVARRF